MYDFRPLLSVPAIVVWWIKIFSFGTRIQRSATASIEIQVLVLFCLYKKKLIN